MKNLLNKKARIDFGLTSDPKNKQGETGIITHVKILDKEAYQDNEYGSAIVTIQFEDGITGLYDFGTFEIL